MSEGDKIIRVYLREIGEVPLLRAEQEVELAARIKRGDEAARSLMIRANLRLVVKIAQDYARYGLPLLDLISEGNIGLMKAVERFDPQKGGKLSTYAAWWIKQAIKRALANQSKTIRLPAHLVDKISKMRRAERKLAERLSREPLPEEIAQELGVDSATIHHWISASIKPASLDAPIGDEEGGSFSDIIGDEKARSPFEEMRDRQLLEEVESLMDRLDPREREILKYRFGLQGVQEETLEDVGVRFHITRERVRQLQNSALLQLRRMLEDHPAEAETPSRRLGSLASLEEKRIRTTLWSHPSEEKTPAVRLPTPGLVKTKTPLKKSTSKAGRRKAAKTVRASGSGVVKKERGTSGRKKTAPARFAKKKASKRK